MNQFDIKLMQVGCLLIHHLENLDFLKLIKGNDEVLNFKGTVHANIVTTTQNSQKFKYGFDAYGSVVCYSIDLEEFSVKNIGSIVWNEKK